MPTFAYTVKDRTGQTHNGTLQIDSRQALVEQLWKQDFVVLSVQEHEPRRMIMPIGRPTVPLNQLVIFSRQLATMVNSGIPILVALDAMVGQVEHPVFRQVLKRVKDEVEGGAGLSASLGKHPGVFSEFFMNMVKAGESSGHLDEILDRLATYLEKSDALRRKVLSSLFYPAIVSFMAFSITAFLVIVIVPQFKQIFTSLGAQLPLPTRVLLAVSDGLRQHILLEILAAIGLAAGVRTYIRTKSGRLWFDQTCLKLPIIGKLVQKVAIARFARTLSTLVKSGVPILTSLEIVAKTAGNTVVERAVINARTSIKEGETIADPLTKSAVFPVMVTRMISVGEKTGALETMLTKIADFYESEVDTAVSGLTTLIEPLIIAFLGLVIGAIVIALFMPVLTITSVLGR